MFYNANVAWNIFFLVPSRDVDSFWHLFKLLFWISFLDPKLMYSFSEFSRLNKHPNWTVFMNQVFHFLILLGTFFPLKYAVAPSLNSLLL